MRICSFLPSATEIVCALGLQDQLAGVTYACDFPPQAQGKPVVVRTRLPRSDDGAEIDRQVREFMARGESLYQVDMEVLEQLAPDLILTQDLCHVCAASPGNLGEALARLHRPPQVLSLSPHTLSDVFADIQRVAEATGTQEEAARLLAELRQRMARVEQAIAGAAHIPRVLCLEWLAPPYVGGHWVPTGGRGRHALRLQPEADSCRVPEDAVPGGLGCLGRSRGASCVCSGCRQLLLPSGPALGDGGGDDGPAPAPPAMPGQPSLGLLPTALLEVAPRPTILLP